MGNQGALVMGFVTAREAVAQSADFEMKDGALVKYRGNAAEVVVLFFVGGGALRRLATGLFPTTEALSR
jgi:hypothetical protein